MLAPSKEGRVGWDCTGPTPSHMRSNLQQMCTSSHACMTKIRDKVHLSTSTCRDSLVMVGAHVYTSLNRDVKHSRTAVSFVLSVARNVVCKQHTHHTLILSTTALHHSRCTAVIRVTARVMQVQMTVLAGEDRRLTRQRWWAAGLLVCLQCPPAPRHRPPAPTSASDQLLSQYSSWARH